MAADYTLDGVGPSVEIGKGNPRVKTSGSSLQARDNADAAFATMQGADPAVDDDLATKRYVDGLLGALPSVDLYDNAGGSAIGAAGAWAAIPMDTARQIDTSEFTHTGSNAHFTWVGDDGTKVVVTGRFTVTSSQAQLVRGRITVDTGGGFVEVTGSRSAEDLPGTSEATVEVFAILTLDNGDDVRIEGQGNSPIGTPTLVVNSSGLEAFALVNAQAAGSTAVEANQYQRKQVQTSLALIAAKGLTTPTGFWAFDRALTEAVVGGAGRDFSMPGVSGNADAYSLVEGVPGAADAVYGLFLDSNSMAEVNNAAVWRARSDETDLSIAAWVRVADYNSRGVTQEQGILGYVNRSSATIGTSTAPTYLLWFDPIQGSGGTYFRIRFGYWDNTTTFVGTTWVTSGTSRPIRVDDSQWVHIGARRIRNGVNDVDSFLYVNGEQVSSILGQNDTGDPTSSNMRLIAGARMASTDEFYGTMRGVTFFRGDYGDAGMRDLYEIGVGI